MKRNELGTESESELKRLREQAGLSQEALARLIGVTAKTVSNWERGVTPANLTIPQVKALCDALGVTLNDLPNHLGPMQIEE
ncbi:MAG: helix-turn-helix domain-containing protein [Coleofasciculus sp. S288]|nr:helix-turn-helix domain-containing protein [Coleofasciculus sp. S288]